MFSINLFNQLEPLSIYVVKPIGEVLGCLDNEINESTSSLTVGLNQQYELTFEIHKTEDSIWFDYLQEGMYLLVEKIGLFKMKQPEISLNGYNDTKHITAYSCDVELEDKNCDISINMGTNISQEYLVSDGESEDGYLSYTDSNNDTQYELIKNPYTNLPYDWILLHNTIPAQLSEFKTKYLRGDFGSLVGSERTITSSTQIENFQKYVDVVPRLKHKFEVTSGNGYEEYSITEFLSYTYSSETITKIVVNNEMAFIKRINDLILFYTKYCKQLSLLDIVLEETGGDWTVGDVFGETNIQNIADKFVLSNKKYQFEISESIYSFLTQTFAETANCVVNFDIVNRKVNVTPVEHIGKDSGIVMSYDNLINSMNITCDEENLSTRLYATGADNLSLTRVNYGLEYVEDLGYKMNAKDVNGKRLYVDDALAEKYQNYIDFINAYRTDCIQYSKDIDRINNEINEIKYRVPRDDLKTDWSTFKKDELEEHLTYFKNLLTSLITSYKEDFGTDGCNADDSVNESYMKNTFYWYDYQAYKGIIAEIECAISTFPYYSDQDKWTDTNKSEYLDRIKAWETEWTLYGAIELQNKIDIYKGNMDILAEKSVIRQDATAEKTALDTAKAAYETDKDNLTEAQKQERLAAIAILERAYNVKYYSIKIWGLADWNSLSAADKSRYLSPQEKEEYGNLSANYYYDEYMKYYNYFIGSVDNAYDYLITLNAQIDSLTDSLETCMESRAELNRQATLSGFTFFGDSPYFSDDDIKAITRLYRDADYSNENILKTDINTTDEVIDICLELLEDAKDQASIVSRPQLTFAVEADNLLGLSDYKAMWSNFKCGNFMLVQYRDNTYVKLRIVAFTFNPRLPSSKDFKIEFSNFTRSRVLISDTSYLLNKATSTSSRSSSSGRGSGNGVFGTSDEIDITISNTMLARLLNSESFGTRVTNVILDTLDVNALTATNATFQGLADGTTTIDGGCITTGSIQSNNYSYNSATGVETGSILRLNDGTLSFGGGKLKWDGSILSVDGAITASSYLSTGGRKSSATGHTGIFIDDAGNLYGGSNNETQIKADGTLSFGGGKITYAYDNNLHDYKLSIEGAITATSLTLNNTGISVGSTPSDSTTGFNLSSAGLLTASNAVIYGTIYATDGSFSGTITAGNGSSIAGWSITPDKIYYNGTPTAVIQRPSTNSTYVFAAGGNSNSDYSDCPFRVTKAGKMYATDVDISSTGTNSNGSTTFNITGGRAYTDSPNQSYTWTSGNTTYRGTSRVAYEGGEINFTGTYGDPVFWDDANSTPTYWSNFNAFGFDLSKYDSGAYEVQFGVDLKTGHKDFYCRIASTFESPVHFNSTIYDKNGDTVIGSDINIKNSISNLNTQSVADFIYSLNPVKFKYNEGTSNRYHHGLIAQSVKEKMDEIGEDWGLYVVSDTPKDGEPFCGLRYGELIPDIIATLKYQKQIIDQLQNELEELKRGNDNNE